MDTGLISVSPRPALSRGFIAALAACGLVSGLALVGLNYTPIGGLVMYSFPGILLGIAFALFFRFKDGQRSLLRSIGFIGFSMFAYYIAFKTAFFLSLISGSAPAFTSGSWADPSYHPSLLMQALVFACAGFIGGILFSADVSVLLAPLKRSQVALGGLAGAVFGISAIADPSYGVLYIVWQCGIALVLGWFIYANRRAIPDGGSGSAGSHFGAVGFAIVGIVLGLSAIYQNPYIQDLISSYTVRANLQAQFGAEPDASTASDVVAVSSSLIMIDQPLGTYFPMRLDEGGNQWFDASDGKSYNGIFYKELYSADPHADPTDANAMAAIADVTQYPTPAWAIYETPFSPYYLPSAVGASASVKRSVLGQTVYYSAPDDSTHGGTYLWVSGDNVVSVLFYSSEEDAFLQAYFNKYPSSLKP